MCKLPRYPRAAVCQCYRCDVVGTRKPVTRRPHGRRLQPLSYAELEARIQAMPQRALSTTAPKRISAAGAQQKLLLSLRGDAPNYELFDPVGNEPSRALRK
jgi:hypothetical protein